MDWDFYQALSAYESGEIDRDQFLDEYPDDGDWLDEIDAQGDED